MRSVILVSVVLALLAAPLLGSVGDKVTSSDPGGGTLSGNAGCDANCDSIVIYLE